jgi:hypothetical protein
LLSKKAIVRLSANGYLAPNGGEDTDEEDE